MKKMLALVFVFFLSACAATGPAFEPAPQPAAPYALIYLYRTNSAALGGRSAHFYIDDVEVASLDRNGYTWLLVPAGPHHLRQKWPIDISFMKTLDIPAQWNAAETYYYRFNVDGTSTGNTTTMRWRLTPMNAGEASEEIQQTRYQEPLGASALRSKPGP